jgi:hypothetical protein
VEKALAVVGRKETKATRSGSRAAQKKGLKKLWANVDDK